MRNPMPLLAVFGFAVSLWAADSIIGTWKVNAEKATASLPATTPMRGRMEVCSELDSGQIELTLTDTMADGTSRLSKRTGPARGGEVHQLQGQLSEGMSLVETFIDPGDRCLPCMRNGKQYMTLHKVVSQDGKIRLQTYKRVDPSGKPIETTLAFERQWHRNAKMPAQNFSFPSPSAT